MSDSEPHQRTIIVAVLDWGLGHATRMIPLIRMLQEQGRRIVLASAGEAMELLKIEFPTLAFEELPAYDVRYSRYAAGLPFVILRQLPRLLRLVRQEQKTIEAIAAKHGAEIVISDNRFGARSKQTRNIFITHQVYIKVPTWIWPAQWLSRRINIRLIKMFDECWVPDYAGKVNLSGELSHRKRKLKGLRFIGPLSRFSPIDIDPEESSFPYDLLMILSGPEPQRSHLEAKLVKQVSQTGLRAVMVRGKSHQTPDIDYPNNLKLVGYADADTLFRLMKESRMIICRSGYSSIMDLAATGKEAILIPTPGQTEQEYLARRFKKEGIFYSESQSSFDLLRALEAASDYHGLNLSLRRSILEKVLTEL